MTHDEALKIIADWIMNDSDQFDLDDFGHAAAEDLLSKLRPRYNAGLTSSGRNEEEKSGHSIIIAPPNQC
jgi:hypothetical protein